MQAAEKTGRGHNAFEAPHHQSFVSLNDHQSQNSHNIVASQLTVQKASPFHDDKEHLNDIWQQQLHQQLEA